MTSNALTVSQFPRLENLVDALAPGASIPFPAQVSSDGTFLKYVDRLDKAQGRKVKILAYVTAGTAAAAALAAAALFSEPVIGTELYTQIMTLGSPAMTSAALTMVAGGFLSMGLAFWTVMESADKLGTRRTKNYAHKLADDGSVFASDLTSNLLPLQTDGTAYVSIPRKTSDGHIDYEYWCAVRPSGATVYRADLGELRDYVDNAVIVSGQLSSAPVSEDMEADLGLDARLDGNMMGLPLSGRISGQAKGPVSSATRFRLLDPATGRSAAVVVAPYVLNKGIVPPNDLRVASADFATYTADPNRLRHALIEAQNLGRAVTVIGRVHPSGQIYAEGISVAGGSEAYLLSVHQTPPLLK